LALFVAVISAAAPRAAAAQTPAMKASVDCRALGARASVVEKVICGRPLSVFGCLVLLPAPNAVARVRRHTSCEDDGPVAPVVFKRMNAADAAFVDNKSPTAFWQGIVERRDGRLVLYARTFLGSSTR
jgi:hypothetical protein